MIVEERKIEHKFSYRWFIKDGYPAKGINYHGSKVFSCFACGGGSTMGYKLAGYEVLGCNEIDKKMVECYEANHHPKYIFHEPIQTFKDRIDLPEELYNLDLLDGSPPCSSFSMAGNREKDWGKEKKFREGQQKQVLDTLFFDFIDLAKRLKPKVVVAENVEGLLLGSAQLYYKKIHKQLNEAGYAINAFLLNASKMGVPQRRKRVFIIGLRKDLANGQFIPALNLNFNEPPIVYNDFFIGNGLPLTVHSKQAWNHRKKGDKSIADCKARAGMRVSDMNNSIVYKEEVLPTLTSKGYYNLTLFDQPTYASNQELILAGTFPQDYNFCSSNPGYLIGMSVPPIMIAQIATRIYEQWISKF